MPSPLMPVAEWWLSSSINRFPFTLAVLPLMTTAFARSSAVIIVVVVAVEDVGVAEVTLLVPTTTTVGGDGEEEEAEMEVDMA